MIVIMIVIALLIKLWNWNSSPCFASTPEQRNENINVNTYSTFLSGDQTHQLILQSHFMSLRHDRPQQYK